MGKKAEDDVINALIYIGSGTNIERDVPVRLAQYNKPKTNKQTQIASIRSSRWLGYLTENH